MLLHQIHRLSKVCHNSYESFIECSYPQVRKLGRVPSNRCHRTGYVLRSES